QPVGRAPGHATRIIAELLPPREVITLALRHDEGTMKAPIVRIGNSRGIRIPKAVLEQCGFGEEAEIAVRNGAVVITPSRRKPREGWEESFAQMAAAGDDKALMP